jgi:hypothetical protein
LTEANKATRVDFCKNFVGRLDLHDRWAFDAMMDTVHIDEKWFFVSKPTVKAYLAPGEEEPHRSTKSKKYITKVMFLCAVARPRFDYTAKHYFDGKIGMWPFVESVPAKRASRNRPKGTMETKSISVTAEVYRQFIVDKVLPAIEEKWPQSYRSMTIKLQQDNAKPHRINNHPDVLARLATMSVKVEMVQQPPNSPDLNVLDLGFFNAIQALQQQQRQRTIDDLIAAVLDSYVALKSNTLNKVFITLQKVMELIILNEGSNAYKLPHLGKDSLMRKGGLWTTIPVSQELIEKLEGIETTIEEEHALTTDATNITMGEL